MNRYKESLQTEGEFCFPRNKQLGHFCIILETLTGRKITLNPTQMTPFIALVLQK